jgi:hypothetical protein
MDDFLSLQGPYYRAKAPNCASAQQSELSFSEISIPALFAG